MSANKTLEINFATNNSYSVMPGQMGGYLAQPDQMQSKRLVPVIESIATGTPDHVVPQSEAAKLVANLPKLQQNQSRIEKLYQNTRIDTRHFAINMEQTIGFGHNQGTIQSRMQMYQEYAVPLAERVARIALSNAATEQKLSFEQIAADIRQIVFVSSTGFIAPGVDTELIKRLGLRRDTARVTVNFMGCAAAMNGLRVACDRVLAHPTHKALVVCLELSSINAVFEDEINDVIIHSIFGDGCAAVVIGASDSAALIPGQVAIRDHFSYLVEETEDGIVLGIRDNGITCKLSRSLPDYIETAVGPIIEDFLASHELTKPNIDLWAVHPGGTRIIEKAQSSLGLSDAQVAHSWSVLRQYGNMLSASVLFVLERMLADSATANAQAAPMLNHPKSLTGIAFSFAPGIGIEGMLFEKL